VASAEIVEKMRNGGAFCAAAVDAHPKTSQTGIKTIRISADNKAAGSECLYDCSFSKAIKEINRELRS
jgi:hypothetical protein